MRRCKDCTKWREHPGYCPIFAAWRPPLTKMCKWMAHEQNLEYMRGYMKERYHADKTNAAKEAAAKEKRKGSKK